MSLLSLTSVKPHLKITESIDSTVLQGKLDAAEAYVSRATGGAGDLGPTTVTERVTSSGPALRLRRLPVISVTSVTGGDGLALVVANLDVDEAHGLIMYSPIAPIVFPLPWYSVVYSSGYATAAAVPDDLVEAVRLMTQHFYETQRGAARPGPGGAANSTVNAKARADEILADLMGAGMA